MIHPLHTKVPGRARFKVDGLRGSEALKRFLESHLNAHPKLLSASANSVTGNILLHFSADLDFRDAANLLAAFVGHALGENVPATPETPGCSAGGCRESERSRPAGLASGIVRSVKEKVREFLPSEQAQPSRSWHTLDAAAVWTILESGEKGISREQAARRLKLYGPNTLPESQPRSRWDILSGQFLSLPVALLGGAAGIALVTGGLLDALVIAGVTVANAIIGYVTECKAEKTIASLKRIVHPVASVLREGKPTEVPIEEVVIGDAVVLKPGTYVPADSRIVRAAHLSIDESALTGESMPVQKRPNAVTLEGVPLAERFNMAYMGTLVTGGEGLAVVVATGAHTEIGRLQILLDETERPETPIERQLRVMGDQLVIFCGLICGAVFLIGFLRGYGFLQMLRTGVSLAAAAVPEGLPAAATINFAMGINKMRKHGVLIRHLQAVETLGAIQTLCLDKTGTITLNRIAVTETYAAFEKVHIRKEGPAAETGTVSFQEGSALRKLIEICTLCNETRIAGDASTGGFELNGSPTEQALIRLAWIAGVDPIRLRQDHALLEITYRSEERLYMTTLHKRPVAGHLLAVKGSPAEVLNLCGRQFMRGETVPLDEVARSRIEIENERMAGQALRVLGVAYALHDDGIPPEPAENGSLVWLGLVGMADPIRDGVAQLMRVFHRAGIGTIMITGDQSATAYAVAEQLNLNEEGPLGILDSIELVKIDPTLMQALSRKVHVYSRVSPAHKLRIVQALQGAGRVVAMTGDGINDGPALKAADLGIAMGESGTDVAREVADVVLEGDDLRMLVIAIADGRSTYRNIRKSVHFFLSTNLTEIIVMFLAVAAGIGFPLSVMQLLWINIISDIFPGLALSMEPPEQDVMQQAPRDPQAPLFDRNDFKQMIRESTVISAASLGAYGFGILRYGMGIRAASLAFQSLTIGQLLHALSCRSESSHLPGQDKMPANPYLAIALGGSLLLQAMTLFVPPLRNFLGVATLGLADLAVVGGSAVIPLIVNETAKGRKKAEEP